MCEEAKRRVSILNWALILANPTHLRFYIPSTIRILLNARHHCFPAHPQLIEHFGY